MFNFLAILNRVKSENWSCSLKIFHWPTLEPQCPSLNCLDGSQRESVVQGSVLSDSGVCLQTWERPMFWRWGVSPDWMGGGGRCLRVPGRNRTTAGVSTEQTKTQQNAKTIQNPTLAKHNQSGKFPRIPWNLGAVSYKSIGAFYWNRQTYQLTVQNPVH